MIQASGILLHLKPNNPNHLCYFLTQKDDHDSYNLIPQSAGFPNVSVIQPRSSGIEIQNLKWHFIYEQTHQEVFEVGNGEQDQVLSWLFTKSLFQLKLVTVNRRTPHCDLRKGTLL